MSCSCGQQWDFKQHIPCKLPCEHILCYRCCFDQYTKPFVPPEVKITCQICSSCSASSISTLHPKSFWNPNLEKCSHDGEEWFCMDDYGLMCANCKKEQHSGVKHNCIPVSMLAEGVDQDRMGEIMLDVVNLLGGAQTSRDLFEELAAGLNDEKKNQRDYIENWALRMIQLILEIKAELLRYLDEQTGAMENELKLKNVLFDAAVQKLLELKETHPDINDLHEVGKFRAQIEKIKGLINDNQTFNPKYDYEDLMAKLEKEVEEKTKLKKWLADQRQQEIDRLKKEEEEREEMFETGRRAFGHRVTIKQATAEEKAAMEETHKKDWSIKFHGDAVYRTIGHGSNKQFNFDVKTQKMEQSALETQAITQNYSFVEQIGDDTFVISGGEINDNRLTFIDNGSIKEYQMLYPRGWHRTAFDRENKLYIISGVNFVNKQPMPVRDNEVFSTSTEKSTRLSRIPTPVYAFGCCFVIDKVYVFGGYNANRGGCVDAIQLYDPNHDRWSAHEKRLPMVSQCSAAHVPALNGVLIWRNGGRLAKTYLFNFKEFEEKGELFPGSSFVYSQPLVAWDEVYVWDAKSRLYCFDLTAGTWSKPLGVEEAK